MVILDKQEEQEEKIRRSRKIKEDDEEEEIWRSRKRRGREEGGRTNIRRWGEIREGQQ